MIHPSKLSQDENYKLFKIIIEMRLKATPNYTIARRLDVPPSYVCKIIRAAREDGYVFPDPRQNGYSKQEEEVEAMPKQGDLSKYLMPRFKPPTVKFQEVKEVKQHFHFTKDFNYLF
jgi:hypothetical protein